MSKVLTIAEKHFKSATEVPIAGIEISDEVRKMCEQNKCGHYGKNWTCPPAVKPLDEFRKEMAQFDSFIVVYHVYNVESSFDFKGMMAGAADFGVRMLAMKKVLEGDCPQCKIKVMSAGACGLCKKCTYSDGKPCRRPDDALVSLEAFGMDVMKLMRDNGLKYYNGKNTVTYIGGVAYSKEEFQGYQENII